MVKLHVDKGRELTPEECIKLHVDKGREFTQEECVKPYVHNGRELHLCKPHAENSSEVSPEKHDKITKFQTIPFRIQGRLLLQNKKDAENKKSLDEKLLSLISRTRELCPKTNSDLDSQPCFTSSDERIPARPTDNCKQESVEDSPKEPNVSQGESTQELLGNSESQAHQQGQSHVEFNKQLEISDSPSHLDQENNGVLPTRTTMSMPYPVSSSTSVVVDENKVTVSHFNVSDTIIRAQNEEELRFHNQLFINTSILTSAREIMRENRVVFIIGPRGSGRTMVAYQLLKIMSTSNDTQMSRLIINSPEEWRQYVNPDVYEVILMKDVFGLNSFNKTGFNMLNKYRINIFNKKMIIFTIPSHVFNEALALLVSQNVPWFSPLNCVNIPQELSQREYSMKEKARILKKHLEVCGLSKTIGEEVIDGIINCKSLPCFPACCKLFCSKAYPSRLRDCQNAVRFFEKPVMYLVMEIREFYNGNEQDKAKFGALVLTMVKYEGLSIQDLDEFYKKEEHDEFRSYLRTVGISDSVPLAKIKESAKYLLGSHLVSTKDRFSFIDSSMHDAVAFVYGEICPEHLVNVCPIAFLHEYIILSSRPYKLMKLRVDSSILAKRLIREIQDGHADEVCYHPALSQLQVKEELEILCQLLHVACVNGHIQTVRILLNEHPQLIDFWDTSRRTPCHIAANCGHEEIFHFVLDFHCKLKSAHNLRGR